MEQLSEHLESLQAGAISDTGKLESLLAACWNQFDGSGAEGMAGDKVNSRIEKVVWNPPILSFDIERHGGTVLGSTRAERHRWEVNIAERTANCQNVGYKQLQPMSPRVNVAPIAEEIVRLIRDRQQDERLQWNDDGSVRIQIAKVLLRGSLVKQTLDGRRKRFRAKVDELLSTANWKSVRLDVYTPASRNDSSEQTNRSSL